ncbi:hypothetical protein, partial [Acetobacter sp.]|uniref:hypothetical protein n=1 Tax=Acetobacter sp. TaxID=440 RepID=UPI0039E8AB70
WVSVAGSSGARLRMGNPVRESAGPLLRLSRHKRRTPDLPDYLHDQYPETGLRAPSRRPQ